VGGGNALPPVFAAPFSPSPSFGFVDGFVPPLPLGLRCGFG
jgi:hypothetical protein